MNNNIEQLLSQVLENTNKISSTLDKHSKILQEHTSILIEHSKRFEKIENILIEHDKRFQKIENILIEHDKRFQKIENILIEHDKRFESIDKRFEKNDERFKSNETIQDNILKRLVNIENIVTRIEIEHGEKIQVLFDYFSSDSDKFTKVFKDLYQINSKLDDLDNRIYALDFYKRELLSTQ